MWAEFTIWDGIGLIGALIVCAAYFSATRGWTRPEGARFNLANLAGSSLLLVSLYVKPNPGAILIEALWAAIAFTALARLLRQR